MNKMVKTKTTFKAEGMTLEVSGEYLDTVEGFPFEKNDRMLRNKFRIRIKNIAMGKAFSVPFYGSQHDQEKGITELNREGLIGALDCIVSDGTYSDYSFEEFCREFDYDDDSRKAERIYRAMQKTSKAWKNIGISSDDLYLLSNAIQEEF